MNKLMQSLLCRRDLAESRVEDASCTWLGWDGWVNVPENSNVAKN